MFISMTQFSSIVPLVAVVGGLGLQLIENFCSVTLSMIVSQRLFLIVITLFVVASFDSSEPNMI